MRETIPKQKKTTPLLESPFLHPRNETIPIHFCHVFVVTVPFINIKNNKYKDLKECYYYFISPMQKLWQVIKVDFPHEIN